MDLAYTQPDSSESRSAILFMYTHATHLMAKEIEDLDFDCMVPNQVTLYIATYAGLRGINTRPTPLRALVKISVSNIHGACIET
jgi:hypothetical protein